MKKIITCIALLALVSACRDSGLELDDYHNQDGSAVKDLGGEYAERKVDVSRNGTDAGTVTLRFYDDMPHVPYINAEDFYHLFMPSGAMSTEAMGDNYQLKTAKGVLTVDVVNDVATSTSYDDFVALQSLYAPGTPGFETSCYPFIKYHSHVHSPADAPLVKLNFSKYGINLHDDGKHVYFPLVTINDMFIDINGMSTCYDGNMLMVCTDPFKELEEYYPDYSAPAFKLTEVDADVAKMRYAELCFVVDNFFGYPGRTVLEKDGLKQNGLDATLDKISGGKSVKAMLKSANQVQFAQGTEALGYLLWDGDHTHMEVTHYMPKSVGNEFDDRCEIAYPSVSDDAKQLIDELEITKEALAMLEARQEEAKEKGWGTRKYLTSKDGKTAVIVLESFDDANNEGWQKYYDGGCKTEDWQAIVSDTETPDVLIQAVEGLRRAKSEGVKNLVLDISNNPGGQDEPTGMIVALLGDKTGAIRPLSIAPSWEQNTLTGQYRTKNFVTDRNFDGKFDEKDDEIDYVGDMNIVVLTSRKSFSNASVFAARMKDYGYQTWGEQTGGGACSIIYYYTPDGMMYRMSSNRSHTTDKYYKSIDSGSPVDISISIDQMYDIEYLSTLF